MTTRSAAEVIELAADWCGYDPGENVPGLVAAIRALDTAGDRDAAGHFAELLREIGDDAVNAINTGDVLDPNTFADWDGYAGGFIVGPIYCSAHERDPDHGTCTDPDACYVTTERANT